VVDHVVPTAKTVGARGDVVVLRPDLGDAGSVLQLHDGAVGVVLGFVAKLAVRRQYGCGDPRRRPVRGTRTLHGGALPGGLGGEGEQERARQRAGNSSTSPRSSHDDLLHVGVGRSPTGGRESPTVGRWERRQWPEWAGALRAGEAAT